MYVYATFEYNADLSHYSYLIFILCLQLKMVLIKACDISNEVRPMEVSEPWVDCLLEEYFNQVSQTYGSVRTLGRLFAGGIF